MQTIPQCSMLLPSKKEGGSSHAPDQILEWAMGPAQLAFRREVMASPFIPARR
jgi:hypothetical protein